MIQNNNTDIIKAAYGNLYSAFMRCDREAIEDYCYYCEKLGIDQFHEKAPKGSTRIPTKKPPTLTIPAKKTKIYAYLETLLGKSKSQKKLIKDANRKYENSQHWNLETENLKPLRDFLEQHLRVQL